MASGCAHLGTWAPGAIRGRSDSYAEGATISGLVWHPRPRTPCGPLSSVSASHLNPTCSLQAWPILGSMRGVWRPGPTPTWPTGILTGIGRDLDTRNTLTSPSLFDLIPDRPGTVLRWSAVRGVDSGARTRRWDPFQGYNNAIDDRPTRHQLPGRFPPSLRWRWPPMKYVASSKTLWATADARATLTRSVTSACLS